MTDDEHPNPATKSCVICDKEFTVHPLAEAEYVLTCSGNCEMVRWSRLRDGR